MLGPLGVSTTALQIEIFLYRIRPGTPVCGRVLYGDQGMQCRSRLL